jgi:hypothetical protein
LDSKNGLANNQERLIPPRLHLTLLAQTHPIQHVPERTQPTLLLLLLLRPLLCSSWRCC